MTISLEIQLYDQCFDSHYPVNASYRVSTVNFNTNAQTIPSCYLHV